MIDEVITHLRVRRTLWFAKRYDWTAIHNNSNIVANSGGQGYSNRSDAIEAMRKYRPCGSRMASENGITIH